MSRWNKILMAIGCCLGILALSMFISCVSLCLCSDELKKSIIKELSNNIGDFSTGTIGILLSFVSTIFLFVTFSFQRNQFKSTMDDSYRTRFEGTFFNMLSMFNNVRSESLKQIQMSTSMREGNLKTFYEGFRSYYRKKIEDNSDFADSMKVFSKNKATRTELETAIYDLGNTFDEYVREAGYNPSFFFRYTHNMVDFVISHWKDDRHDMHVYLNFIQAQMTDEELALLFYDSISDKGLDKNKQFSFKENLDKTSFLENIPSNVLINRQHYKCFPHTMFTFLNADERAAVRR